MITNPLSSKLRKRVVEKINAKITQAEEKHKQKCIDIDAEADQKKEAHLEEMVDSIIGKII